LSWPEGCRPLRFQGAGAWFFVQFVSPRTFGTFHDVFARLIPASGWRSGAFGSPGVRGRLRGSLATGFAPCLWRYFWTCWWGWWCLPIENCSMDTVVLKKFSQPKQSVSRLAGKVANPLQPSYIEQKM